MTGFNSQRVLLLPLRDYLARLTTVHPQAYISVFFLKNFLEKGDFSKNFESKF